MSEPWYSNHPERDLLRKLDTGSTRKVRLEDFDSLMPCNTPNDPVWEGGIDGGSVRVSDEYGNREVLGIVMEDPKYDHFTVVAISREQAAALRLYLDKWLWKLEHGQ